MAEYNLDKLITDLDKVEKGIKEISIAAEKTHQSIDKMSGNTKLGKLNGSIKKLSDSNNKLTDAEKKQNEERKKAEAIQKKAIRLQKQANKEADKYSVQAQKRIANERAVAKATSDRAKALVALQRAEKGSIAELKAKNRLLNLQREQLKVGTKRYEAYTRAILRNEIALKRNDAAIGRNQREVGSYQNALKGVRSGFSKLAISAVAIIGAFRLISRSFKAVIGAFSVQEQAVKDNVSVFGAYSKVLQQNAADIQKVTTVGDEQSLSLMTQAANFGIVSSEVTDATKGAIGLAEKFKKAGLSQETALKGIALAYSGNFSQLERYIPALRNAGSEAEKMAILQKEMASGFNLSKKAAQSQTGQLEQLSNQWGDLKEVLGAFVLNVLKPVVAGLKQMVTWMTKVTKVKMSESLEKERDEVNKLAISLSNSNTTGEDRVKILEQLKEINPDIVKGLDAENLNYEQLTANVEQYNEAVLKKITLAKLDEETQEQLEDAADRTVRRLEKEYALQEEIFKIDKKIALSKGTIIEKYEAANKKLQDRVDLANILSASNVKTLFEIDELKSAHLRYINSLDKENEALADTSSIQFRIEAMRKMLGLGTSISEQMQNAFSTNIRVREEEVITEDQRKKDHEAYLKRLKEKQAADDKYYKELYEDYTEGGRVGVPDAAGFENDFDQYLAEITPIVQKELSNTYNKWQLYWSQLVNGEGNFFTRLFGGGEAGEETKQKVTEIINKGIDLIQQGLDARRAANDEIISMSEERINQLNTELQAENDRINELKNAGAAYDLSQKESLEKRLVAEQKLKQKALADDKKLKQQQKAIELTSATIGIAGAVIGALGQKPFTPLNIILASIVAALGAVQLGVIASAKYADGTEYVQLGGNRDGVDTVPAMLTAGEGVITKDVNSKIPYNKGFKHWMIPQAAEMLLNGGSHIYMNDNSVSEKHLKNIDNNTRKDTIRDASGRIVYRKKGNHTINY